MRQSHDHLQRREINETSNLKHISVQIFVVMLLYLVIICLQNEYKYTYSFVLIFLFNDAKCYQFYC